MNEQSTQFVDPWSDPAARVYLIFGLVAAVALGLALMQYSDEIWTVAPTLIAVAGLLFRWLSAPVFVVLGVAMTLLVSQRHFAVEHLPLSDGLLAGSVVAVMLAHFRLLSITTTMFPHDPRRTLSAKRQPRPARSWFRDMLMVVTVVPYIVHVLRKKNRSLTGVAKPERRKGSLAKDEWARAVGVVIGCSAVGVLLWAATDWIPPPLLTIREQWRLGLAAWFTLLPILVVAVVIGYYTARRRTFIEARMILTDELWRETRGDQRRMARWINRARLRHDHRRTEGLS
jgi:hypothetical protein